MEVFFGMVVAYGLSTLCFVALIKLGIIPFDKD